MQPPPDRTPKNIVLISLMWEINNLGSLNLSTLLRSLGHRATDVFMSRGEPESKDELAALNGLLTGLEPDLVGLSLMTFNFNRARAISGSIRDALPGVPIVWGGVHPTIAPEECLEHADAVVRGEGEGAITDIVDALAGGGSLEGIPNVGVMIDGEPRPEPVRPPEEDLDRFPFPRFSLDSSYVRDEGHIEPLTVDLYRKNVVRAGVIYDVMMTRGCPFKCTYCCNWSFRKLYEGKGPVLRSRSVGSVMQEIDWAVGRFPFIRMINMQDDSFLSADEGVIRNFAEEFKGRGLQLICKALPNYITEGKLGMLKDAGLEHIQIGLQGSDRTNREVYRRNISSGQFLGAARLIRKFGLAGRYDVIVDNPFETDDDRLQLVRTLAGIPKPYWLNIFPLAYFPGTEIAEMAARDGIDVGESDGYHYFYGKPKRDFLNLLIQAEPRMSTWLVEFFLRHRGRGWAFRLLSIYSERYDKARLSAMKWVSQRPGLMKLVKRVYFFIRR